MDAHPRYRIEGGRHVVDVRLTGVEQLFDNRDPAPFGARDLDPDVVGYLIGAAEDLAPRGPFDIVLWLPAPSPDVPDAVRAHLADQLAVLERRRHRQRRIGLASLGVGVALLLALQVAAELFVRLPDTWIRNAVREGLVILSWVAMWRPVDILIYDWIPFRRQRGLLRRLRDAPVEVRAGKGPPSGS